MNMQLADLTSNTGLTLHNSEQELGFLDSYSQAGTKQEYWLTLGSSKSRTTDQERLSRDLLTNIIGSCNTDTIVCFTDGSCLGNPDPCELVHVSFCQEPVLLEETSRAVNPPFWET